MDIAIVDDEINEINKLSDKVKSYMEKTSFPYHISIYTSGLDLFKTNRAFDLIFLDIQMSGLSGMETAQKLRQEGNHSFIVFVTVLQEYVYDAFEVTASDYLLKPVDDSRFNRMMDRVCTRVQEREKSSLVISSRGNTCKTISLINIL